ncbi:MAG: pyruvate ferredoxin oxidoreductase [Candidatus Eisenbacteria bacterium]|nr:pyruvate ferredoxin oxidoreductase [Candidatus Eisenbacteria bacterium]
MKKVIVGNHAVSWGVQLARAEVISAYPITPQTQIVEELSEMCADGRLPARFIKVESEHSAMAACIGASVAGVRTFTATSSQGLLLMHEMLHYAAGGRLPVVMADINRAVAPGWNIWTDQNDSLSQRDTGWIQLYCENNQEVLDTTVQSFKLAEAVDLPVMLVLDAFYLSHTSEPVDIPDQADVDTFLPKREARLKLDVNDPRAFGALSPPDMYMELRLRQQEAMEQALEVFDAVEAEWGERFGRRYGAIEPYRTEDAEIVLVTSGTVTSTARYVVDERRARGEKVGLVKIKMFRPFPTARLRRALAGIPRVAVLDRNLSPGRSGIFAEELRAALYDLEPARRPGLDGYVIGLGGRDVTPDTIGECLDRSRAALAAGRAPEREDLWVGVKP